jgi:hypothetical protein
MNVSRCDWVVWLDTTDLARAFGWKPRSRHLRQPLSKLIDDPAEVGDEDAQSLALAIRQCLSMPTTNQRLSRRQFASLLCLNANTDRERGHVDLMQFAITSILEPTRVMAADRKPEAGGEFPRPKLSISIDAKSRRGAVGLEGLVTLAAACRGDLYVRSRGAKQTSRSGDPTSEFGPN